MTTPATDPNKSRVPVAAVWVLRVLGVVMLITAVVTAVSVARRGSTANIVVGVAIVLLAAALAYISWNLERAIARYGQTSMARFTVGGILVISVGTVVAGLVGDMGFGAIVLMLLYLPMLVTWWPPKAGINAPGAFLALSPEPADERLRLVSLRARARSFDIVQAMALTIASGTLVADIYRSDPSAPIRPEPWWPAAGLYGVTVALNIVQAWWQARRT